MSGKQKILMMRGLPASGKTTYARELVEKEGYIRINKDDIRSQLLANKEWDSKLERLVVKVEKEIARTILEKGYNLVVDDTNLPYKYEDYWRSLADGYKCKFEIKDMMWTVSMEECILRSSFRSDKPNWRDIIFRIAIQFGYWAPSKDVVLVDIDGTINKAKWRDCYLLFGKKDWDSYFEASKYDAPNKPVLDRIYELSSTHDVIFLTGRSEKYNGVTQDWIEKNYKGDYVGILYRNPGNRFPTADFKRQMLEEIMEWYPRSKIKYIFEDYTPCIDVFKDLRDGELLSSACVIYDVNEEVGIKGEV